MTNIPLQIPGKNTEKDVQTGVISAVEPHTLRTSSILLYSVVSFIYRVTPFRTFHMLQANAINLHETIAQKTHYI